LEQEGIAEQIRNKYSTALSAPETVAVVPTAGTNRTQNLIMAFGQDKPPFVFGEERRGLEIDIVQEAFKVKGYTVSIEHMPNNRLQIALLRACSKSFEKERQKCQDDHLKRSVEEPFTILPKSSTFIQPGKRPFDHPAFRNHDESMEFRAFRNLYLSLSLE
jgi:hypothetical protein